MDVEFVELRPYLFAVAYRMLGSTSEAEDAVRGLVVAYLRWAGADPRAMGYLHQCREPNVAEIAEGLVGILEQQLAGFCEPDAAARPLEQPRSQMRFELPDFLRYRRRRHAQPAGSGGESAAAGDHPEGRQKRKEIRQSLSPAS